MRVVIRQSWSRRGVDIWFLKETANGFRRVKPIELEFLDEQTYAGQLDEPTFQLRQDEWDQLKKSVQDEMCANGFASNPNALEGELKATKFHLEDMRNLALTKNKR